MGEKLPRRVVMNELIKAFNNFQRKYFIVRGINGIDFNNIYVYKIPVNKFEWDSMTMLEFLLSKEYGALKMLKKMYKEKYK